MTTRPLSTLRFARATVTAPDGTQILGQTSVTVGGMVEVIPKSDPDGEPLTFGPGEVTKQGSYGWLIDTEAGPVIVERAPGACGSCGGRR